MENISGIKTVKLDSMQVYQNMIKYSDGDFAIIDNIRYLPELAVYKIETNIVIVCTEGKLQLDVNGKTIGAKAGEVLFFPPGVIMDNYLISPVFECKILCMSNKIVQKFLQGNIDIWNSALYISKQHSVTLSEDNRKNFNHYYELIISAISKSDEPLGKEIVESLIRSALLFLCSLIPDSKSELSPKNGRGTKESILEKFLELLSVQTVKRQPLDFYAEKLCITPKYLSSACRAVSGKTASQWIGEYVAQDIFYYLKNTDISVKEIADTLGFENLSFFGKYVKHTFGLSPRDFRKKNK